MATKTSRKQNKSILLRILIVAFCVYMFVSLVGLYGELCSGRDALADVQAEIRGTQARIDERNDLLQNSTEEELIEKAARERLGFVYPNERVYVDKSGN